MNELIEIVNRYNQQNGHVESDEEVVSSSDDTEPIAEAVNTSSETVEVAQDVSSAFMVPTDVDLTLLTKIKNAHFADETLSNLGGRLYVKDGKLILEEMGFICEVAKMQLTAMYKTPRRNHLYVGADFHLIDIDIANLIRMIPMIDSLVPMLKQFDGKAQFHIALETYMTDQYQPKKSTMRGACSIEGKDLVLIPGDIFKKASKLLMFSPKTRNNIDSISVQLALYKTQVTVYPFCLSIDKYMAAVGGTHYMDMNYNYHASLLKPVYLGVDVKGNLDDMDIKLAPVRYAQDFRPLFHRDAEDRSAELRTIISESLKKSVKIQ